MAGRLIRSVREALGIWTLSAALAAPAVLLATHLAHAAPRSAAFTVPWWVLAAGFALTEVCVVHIHLGRGAKTFAVGEIPLVLGLLFGAPAHIPLAWATGVAVAMAIGRYPAARIAFNVVQVTVASSLAADVFHALAPSANAFGPATWLAAAGAAAVGVVAGSVLVFAALSASRSELSVPGAARMLAFALAASLINASLALAAGVVLDADPRAAALLVAPAALIFAAYRAYSAERERRNRLQFLYEASRPLAAGDDLTEGLAGTLAMARRTFRARRAEVCVLGDEPWSLAVDDERVVPRTPLGHERVDELSALLAGGPGATVAGDTMLAPLPGEDGLTGAILFTGRLGVATPFEADDLRLCETLASQLGSLVQVRELHHQAFHDPLTGLANRALFADRVRHALVRRDGNAAVLYIDLDDFKPINDTLGHEAGDAVLRVSADRLRDSLRAADTAARLGGDEFAVLLVDIAPRDAEMVATRILHALRAPIELEGGVHAVGASLGLALAHASTIAGDELLRHADEAMYAAKHGGKNALSIYAAEPATA